MSLDPEWRDRLNAWRRELENHFYRRLGAVELEGLVTDEQLTARQAAKGDFRPMPPGTKWGGKWQYGWFRCRVACPAAAAGRRLVMYTGLGAETLAFIGGRAFSGQTNPLTLSRKAGAGETFDVLLEAYAGHGPMVCSVGPVPPGRVSIPEPPETQQEVGAASFGVWQEEAYQLAIDVATLFEIRQNVEADSLRVAEIDKALKDFTLIVDFELPPEQMLETFGAARERLRPLLACRNGTTAPEFFCFGHGHLDVAWLWPLQHTERKIARTIANQLELFEEYPRHRFLQSQPQLFCMLRDRYPELYERAKKAVADGRLIAEGGMWVEADTNISGGEALIRQFIHGKRFFRDEFGVDCELLWLPDVFGYSAALPQIMAGCGIKYFSTHKIFWNYHGGETFPYHNFVWAGIDGSEVIVHLHNDYNSRTSPEAVIRRWKSRVQADGMSTRLFPFGHGDGGGGPAREHLEYLRRLADCEGVPKMRIATPVEFFEDLVGRGEHDVNRYVGELYFQAHRGTLTSQAGTKRLNRKAEIALREAEMWSAAAASAKGFVWPADEMDRAWKKLLLNQFHDVLPGSSIHRVYEEAEAAYAEVVEAAGKVSAAATAAVTDDSDALTVFNSLNWPRKALVELPAGWPAAADVSGDPLCVQEVDGRELVEVSAPSCGWTTLTRADRPRAATCAQDCCGVKAAESLLENSVLRVEFNDRGEIVSIFDKEQQRELAAGPCNVFKMYKDVPSQWDAWDIDSMYKDQPVDLADGPAEVQVVTEGPLVGIIRVGRTLNNSPMTQEISLRRGRRQVDFATKIDWQESHKLLKVAFEPDVHAEEAIFEIQFGHVRRPDHASRQYDADRFEVANHKWTALAEEARGFAVLNDCKYGVNVLGRSINLTLLRAPLAPDATADRGRHEFTYAFHVWNSPLAESDVARKGYELNVPVVTAAGAAGEESLLSVDRDNIVVEAVKLAEDGGDVIVRLYESKRTACRCVLTTSLPVASAELTDMLENNRGPLAVEDGRVALDFRAFEIKTIRLKMR